MSRYIEQQMVAEDNDLWWRCRSVESREVIASVVRRCTIEIVMDCKKEYMPFDPLFCPLKRSWRRLQSWVNEDYWKSIEEKHFFLFLQCGKNELQMNRALFLLAESTTGNVSHHAVPKVSCCCGAVLLLAMAVGFPRNDKECSGKNPALPIFFNFEGTHPLDGFFLLFSLLSWWFASLLHIVWCTANHQSGMPCTLSLLNADEGSECTNHNHFEVSLASMSQNQPTAWVARPAAGIF